MIYIIPGKPLEPKYRNLIVLSAKFMHGDADMDTFSTLIAQPDSQEEMGIVKAVFDFYESLPEVHYGGKEIPVEFNLSCGDWKYIVTGESEGWEDDEEEEELNNPSIPEMGVYGDLGAMFPWDQIQAEIGMYEHRAHLKEYSLIFYDSLGRPHSIVLEEM